MTKVIIIGEQPEKKELKPIELVKHLDIDFKFSSGCSYPEVWVWENIELICKNYFDKYDLMFAFDEDRSNGILYLGHFNDGVV
jgi:hypothetical protein